MSKKSGLANYTKTDGDGSFIFGATPDDFSKEDINKPDLKADKGNAKPGKTTEEPEIHRSGDEEPLTEKELNELRNLAGNAIFFFTINSIYFAFCLILHVMLQANKFFPFPL